MAGMAFSEIKLHTLIVFTFIFCLDKLCFGKNAKNLICPAVIYRNMDRNTKYKNVNIFHFSGNQTNTPLCNKYRNITFIAGDPDM